MTKMFDAEASPEKRLFISLITRDITLADAIIDLLDNSVNAAMRPIKNNFSSAADFYALFTKKGLRPSVTIRVAAQSSLFLALVVSFSRIFLRHADIV